MKNIGDMGLWTALVTPFDREGNVDREAFESHVRRQVAAGIRGLLLFGSTGEAATLSEEEKSDLLKCAVQLCGDALLMVGTTHNDTRIAVDSACRAHSMGAHALLVAPPYYNKPSQRGLMAHYKAIHDAVDLPIVLYNIPSRVGVAIGTPALQEMARWPRIVGLKEAAGDLLLAAHGVRSKLVVWSGDDPAILPYMSLGAVGAISVNSNLFPDAFLKMLRLAGAGEGAAARDLALKFTPWYGSVFVEGNPTGIKAALALRGWMQPTLRLPLIELSTQNTIQLKESLAQLDAALNA